MTSLRILVVEDEPLVAMDMQDVLEGLGMQVVGTAASLAEALELAEAGGFDGAFLDVNLRGERIDRVADRLATAGIPFVFTTGQSMHGLPEAHRERPVLTKPFRDRDLTEAVRKHLGGG
ncbi:response regulator [Arenibaculum sp.]|jgi:CheY-like chemotaxis protein|uniref:response regulator n=1 Tax=Arenibaculum sp. TaxID=2865862 RepID=UPI002E145084|nr:response regulator [Arenibaculum sp.]